MEISQLEAFVAVVEEKSFSRSAARLLRTQPAVSLSMKRLEEGRRAMLATIPGGRVGEPLEIACAAAYLVSDFADFITGEVLVMDGGQWRGKGIFGIEPSGD